MKKKEKELWKCNTLDKTPIIEVLVRDLTQVVIPIGDDPKMPFSTIVVYTICVLRGA